MKQTQNTSLWSKIKELMSKIKTLLVKKIENWTTELDKKITIANGNDKKPSPARVLDTGAPDVNNQGEQHENIEENQVPTSPPATVINKTKVSLGLGELFFFGIIIYALFSVPGKTDHVDSIAKATYEIIISQKSELSLLDPTKIQSAIKATAFEELEVENYYLFSVCHKKSNHYDFPNDLLDGNFISFGILGKVFTRQGNMEKKIKENMEREQRDSQDNNNSNIGNHDSDGDNTLDSDNDSQHGSGLEIITDTRQFGDEIETYAKGCDYQVTHTVVVANRSDRDVSGEDYYLSVEPVDNDEYDYSETNTSYVEGKDIPAHRTATFTWTDVHFDGTWTYEDSVELNLYD